MHVITKSDFLSGTRCLRKLWWEIHEPNAPELRPDASLQWKFEQGKAVGLAAREYVPGARYETRLEGEAVSARTDILEQLGGGRQALIEVKATKSLKEEHVIDAAFQRHVAGVVGEPIERVEVMHLSGECRYPDLSNLFRREEVTEEVQPLLAAIPAQVAVLQKALDGGLPEVPVGMQCFNPEECPFLNRCWPRPRHHVSTLHSIRKKKVLELERQGFDSVTRLPPEMPLTAIQQRQRQSVLSNQLIVEPGLGAALARWPRPLVFLDFETVTFGIPRFTGNAPWDQVPVQFSAHVESGSDIAHHAFLAEGQEDPRAALAAALVAACAGAGTVVAYFKQFEAGCLEQLALAVPGQAASLTAIRDRLQDLLPVVRDHVYHPDFNGSFSLKSVLPALVPELSYDNLAIGGGELAQAELCRLLYGPSMGRAEIETLRAQLLAYCERDTWAMVALMERLRGLSSATL